MDLKNLFSGLLGKSGIDFSKLGETGVKAILEQLKKLGDKAGGDDKQSITDIVGLITKALGSNTDLKKAFNKCITIAKKIKDGGLREAVMALLKK